MGFRAIVNFFSKGFLPKQSFTGTTVNTPLLLVTTVPLRAAWMISITLNGGGKGFPLCWAPCLVPWFPKSTINSFSPILARLSYHLPPQPSFPLDPPSLNPKKLTDNIGSSLEGSEQRDQMSKSRSSYRAEWNDELALQINKQFLSCHTQKQ